MIIIPNSILSTVAYDNDAPKVKATYDTRLTNKRRFDELFAVIFDSPEAQQLLAQSDLSNMLHTIAYISANK